MNQAFVAVSGRGRGWIASIAFAMLQVVSIGGLVPIDTAPGPFQLLNKVLPVSRAVDGFAHLTLGGQVGSLAADVAVLVTWGVGALPLHRSRRPSCPAPRPRGPRHPLRVLTTGQRVYDREP